jgi:hypothetical protein
MITRERIEELTDAALRAEHLVTAIFRGQLTEKEFVAALMVFGAGILDQSRIARVLGVSQQRASDLCNAMLTKITNYLRAVYGYDTTWQSGMWREIVLPPANGSRNAGERNGGARLTRWQVLEIKRLARNGLGWRDVQRLADEFGVSQSTIRAVLYGVTWRHVAIEETDDDELEAH